MAATSPSQSGRRHRQARGTGRSDAGTPTEGVDDQEQQASSLGTFPPPTATSERLAEENLNLARQQANRYAAKTGIPYSDMFQVACLGLLRGCRRYDPDRLNPKSNQPYKLSTYAVHCIRREILHYLRKHFHSSGAKFPDKWRETGPKVRALAANGTPKEAIAAATGLDVEEVSLILESQGATREIDPEAFLFARHDPELLEAAEERYDELRECLDLVDQAWANLDPCDRQMLIESWERPRRRELAFRPLQQFRRRVSRLLRGFPLSEANQEALELELPPMEGADPCEKRVVKSPRAIIEAVEQLALLTQD